MQAPITTISFTGNYTLRQSKIEIQLREPDLLIVLTGGEMAYTRPDGIKVIPIGSLKD